MIKWSIVRGVGGRFSIFCKKRGVGNSAETFPLSGAETFVLNWWSGEDNAVAGTLPWAFGDLTQGEVIATVSSAVASNGMGVYQWVLQLSDGSAAYARGAFEIVAGPGSTAYTITPYCSYQDILDYAPWVKQIASADTDTAGFLDKRVLARQWFDNVILANFRGVQSNGFGDAYFSFSRAWRRRTTLPSKYLTDLLAANALIVDAQVKRINAYKAASMIGLGQVGLNNAFAALGRMLDDKAEEECVAQTCLVDTNADGVGDLPIPLGSTATLFT